MQRTDIFTYFTKSTGETDNPYSADGWVTVRLRLETAGPVAVGTRAELAPVLSGRGILLPSDGSEISFTLTKGDRLYAISETLNRVKFIVEPQLLEPQTEALLQALSIQSVSFANAIVHKEPPPAPPPKPICPPKLRVPRF